MGAASIALAGTVGLLLGFLLPTVYLLRRRLVSLRSHLLRLEAAVEDQEARLFVLEEELRWLSSDDRERGETVSKY